MHGAELLERIRCPEASRTDPLDLLHYSELGATRFHLHQIYLRIALLAIFLLDIELRHERLLIEPVRVLLCPMPRYRLTIAYEGTAFHGWQKQWRPDPSDVTPDRPAPAPFSAERDSQGRYPLRTVQHVVEQAIREVIREPILLQGASRTDAGVHARAQTAAFTASEDRRGPPDDRLRLAINSRLPDDVVVVDCRPTRDDFEPISDCLAKGYRYLIHTGFDRPLWDRRFVHHLCPMLDVDRMKDAAARMVGEHDFAAYAKAGHGRLTTVRTVLSCEVSQLSDIGESVEHHGDGLQTPSSAQRIAIDISGTGFLHNMVRIMVGTLVDVGRGRFTPEQVTTALTSGDRRTAGPTLPATGLCLMWMRYPDDS